MANSAYSPIQHLASALFLHHDPKRVLMVCLTAYFDASGSRSDRATVAIAGFVSTEEKWRKFETEWNEVLRHYKVPYLHMKEFTSSTGAVKTWKHDEERRKSFLIDLITVAKKRVHKSFVCSVMIEDFDEVNRQFTLQEHWGRPYSLVGNEVVGLVIKWKKKDFLNSPIKYIFEAGDLDASDLERCLRERQLPYAFTPKKEKQQGEYKYLVPFQLADFAAWENRNAVQRSTEAPLRELRKSFEALYKQIPSDWRMLTKENLVTMCEHHRFQRS